MVNKYTVFNYFFCFFILYVRKHAVLTKTTKEQATINLIFDFQTLIIKAISTNQKRYFKKNLTQLFTLNLVIYYDNSR